MPSSIVYLLKKNSSHFSSIPMQTHILIAGAIELVFLLPSVILLVGAAR